MNAAASRTVPVLDPATLGYRARFYRYLSEGLRYPGPGTEAWIRMPPSSPALHALPGLDDARRDHLRTLLGRVRNVAALLPEGRLEPAWLDAFASPAQMLCSPYETGSATEGRPPDAEPPLAEIAGFYEAFGVKVCGDALDRPDAIQIELEFLSLLIQKEALALSEGLEEAAAVCRAAQERFLTDHLARWGPSFGRKLAEHAPASVYGALGRLLAAWLPADLSILDLPEPSPATEPAV